MIRLKTSEEIELMKEGGAILLDVLNKTLKEVKAGISLSDLDRIAEKLILEKGAYPSFKRVSGYRWTICGCVNDVVVHGIPNEYILKVGDVVGIDCGVYHKGFHTDAAWTVVIRNTDGKENKSDEVDKFLVLGKNTLQRAIEKVRIGNYIYDISKIIQDSIQGSGYSVVKTLVGHGVGRNLHEDPEVPGVVRAKREKTPKIVSGMVLAIEVIYNMGEDDVVYKGNDGWTIVTKDGKISGLFEATVAATPHGCLILTPFQKSKSIYASSGNN